VAEEDDDDNGTLNVRKELDRETREEEPVHVNRRMP